MQENCSAFEGWAVVIKATHPYIKTAVLDWMTPTYNPEKQNIQKAHYNRFLMRVANFNRCYTWFEVIESRRAEVDWVQKKLDNKELVVNFPKSPCRKDEDIDKKKKPEAWLERRLVKEWNESNSVTDEQLPVGLFTSGRVSKETTFTPRGASQIDLWQLYDKTMHIYELKVAGNESIGIISELMFYVCTIQNIVKGLISYPDISKEKDYRHFKEFATGVENHKIKRVIGYFTASEFHPLIESLRDRIKCILNTNSMGVQFDYRILPKY